MQKFSIRYYGGKQRLAPKLIKMMPKHTVYCEPFVGGGSLFWAKEPSAMEYLNDTNHEVVNFYRVSKSNLKELIEKIDQTLYAKTVYDTALKIYRNPTENSELDRAWAFFCLTRMSFASKIGGGFGRDYSQGNKEVKSFNTHKESFSAIENDIYVIQKRLQNVTIECGDALVLLKRMIDKPQVFVFCDPPYVDSNQGHYGGYSESDFIKLLDLLSDAKFKFILTCYPSKVVTDYINKNQWNLEKRDLVMSVFRDDDIKVKPVKTELIIFNYDI